MFTNSCPQVLLAAAARKEDVMRCEVEGLEARLDLQERSGISNGVGVGMVMGMGMSGGSEVAGDDMSSILMLEIETLKAEHAHEIGYSPASTSNFRCMQPFMSLGSRRPTHEIGSFKVAITSIFGCIHPFLQAEYVHPRLVT